MRLIRSFGLIFLNGLAPTKATHAGLICPAQPFWTSLVETVQDQRASTGRSKW
jgi:hypothetical protein